MEALFLTGFTGRFSPVEVLMHHSLRFYSQHRQFAIRFYIFWARWTRIPLIGRLVRRVANAYGRNMEGAYLLTATEVEEIVGIAPSLAVGPCDCRTAFSNCDNPINTEIMLGLSGNVFVAENPQEYREITSDEARDILRECHRRGLIHTIVKCRQDFYAICNCCACCCVPLRLSKQYGIGDALNRNDDIVAEFRNHLISHTG
ncbi:MAG: ferredoxin-like protein [Chloroflexi bacterium]|nr:ferredoxin-like protein [Chloroflexota bacterium]